MLSGNQNGHTAIHEHFELLRQHVHLAGQRDLENFVESYCCPLLVGPGTGHDEIVSRCVKAGNNLTLSYMSDRFVIGATGRYPRCMQRAVIVLAVILAANAAAQEAARPVRRDDLLALVLGEERPQQFVVPPEHPLPGLVAERLHQGGTEREKSRERANVHAARAGLRDADEVIAIDGVKVALPVELVERVQQKGVGEKVTLTVLRGAASLTMTLALEARPDEVQVLKDHLLGKPAPVARS